MTNRLKMLALAAAAMMTAAPAAAATYMLELQASTASTSLFQIDSGGFRFNFQSISAITGYSPITLVLGDIIEAHITLDAPLTVPSGATRNEMDFFLGDTTGAAGAVETSGTTTLFLGGIEIANQASGASSLAFLFNGYTNFAGTAFSFDEVQSNFTITSLEAASITPDAVGLRGISVEPLAAVPEPATWAMMIAGFGLVGAAMRRRSRAFAPA